MQSSILSAKRGAIYERGAALVSAIFLLVVLAALGAYMVTVSGVQQSTASRSLINTRTYFVARAGLEWGIHQTVSPAFAGGAVVCPAPATFSPTGFGFDGVSVAVNCSRTQYDDGVLVNTYVHTSTASHGTAGTTEYVERRLEATVCRAGQGGAARCNNTSVP